MLAPWRCAIYRKILWAHDGSDLAARALPHVIAHAQAFDAEVVICRVIDIDPGVDSTETRPAEGVVSNEALDEAEAALREAGIDEVRAIVMQGVPERAVSDTAIMEEADLIIIATHARRGIARAILGSVSDSVTRSTPGIPVLVVHPADRDGEDGEDEAGDEDDEDAADE